LNKKVFTFELDGFQVLGFDTGLNAEVFARVKLANIIDNPGAIIYPNGETETWLPGGVIEHETEFGKTMVIWGPLFPGRELTGILDAENRRDLPIDAQRRDEALDALRCWLKARMVFEKMQDEKKDPPFNGPAGAFIVTDNKHAYPAGTIFFPPKKLLLRTLKAEDSLTEAESWVHPDLDGAAAISFCAGAMLYRIFCGACPFSRKDVELLRQDMREGVLIPPKLAAPGLDEEIASVLYMSLGHTSSNGRGEKLRPPPGFISDLIGPPSSKPVSFWVKSLSEEEKRKIRFGKEQYKRKTDAKVKTRRFIVSNTAKISIAAIAFVILMLLILSLGRRFSELPATAGMLPLDIAEAYYGAFNTLDHTLMGDCTSGRAGKNDIMMVASLFVIDRARQAYEFSRENFLPAPEWLEAGKPDTNKLVFGITDLDIRVLSENNENAGLEAHYILWISGENSLEGQALRDRLELSYRRGLWRITQIERVKY